MRRPSAAAHPGKILLFSRPEMRLTLGENSGVGRLAGAEEDFLIIDGRIGGGAAILRASALILMRQEHPGPLRHFDAAQRGPRDRNVCHH